MTTPAGLPPFYLITPEPLAGRPFDEFIVALEQALVAGVRLVQLRAKTLPASHYAELAQHVLGCCRRHQARLLLNAPVPMAQALQADGVHLGSLALLACEQRPLPPGMLVSAACHDVRQVQQANRLGLDLVTLSPVLPTATHAEAEPLGWDRLRVLAAQSRAPVYALGGLHPAHLTEARAAGAYGIAAIRSLWGGAAGALPAALDLS